MTNKKFYGADNDSMPEYQPTLFIQWARDPLPPDNLKPSGEAAVSIAKPTLRWNFHDPFGDSSETSGQRKVHIQVTTDPTVDGSDSFTSTVFDSGTLPQVIEEYDLNNTGTSLSTSEWYYWHVRAQDGDGHWSAWSDIAKFRRVEFGSTSITSPTATTEDKTPPIVWENTGFTQESARVILFEQNSDTLKYDEVWDSDWLTTTITSLTVPRRKIRSVGRNYKAVVRVRDEVERQYGGIDEGSAYVDRTYVHDSQIFQFDKSASVDDVLTLVASSPGGAAHPAVRLTWTRTNTPDYFCVRIDDDAYDARIDPEDVRVNATTYQVDLYPAPMTEHTYEVEAVVTVSGRLKHSADNPTVDVTTTPAGMWLVNLDANEGVPILGRGNRDLTIGEDVGLFFPINRRDPVRIWDVLRGYEGSVEGIITTLLGVTGAEYRQRIEVMMRGADVRLIVGDLSLPVFLDDVHISPQPLNDGSPVYVVSFAFYQIDDFVFRGRRRD